MTFTDVFVRRPVLALVVSALILLLGLLSLTRLPIRQYPLLESSTVTITTEYPGASAELMQGFIAKLALPEAEKTRLLAMTPASYTGLAEALARRV